jgi:putative iron-dependent peroxidase
MGEHQWYLHFSRLESHDINIIKNNIKELRTTCLDNKINLTLAFGPSMLKDTTHIKLENKDFVNYYTFKATDGSGKEAKATQEDLLVWINHDKKGLLWKTQWDLKQKMKDDMKLSRETMTFIYGNSQDLSGFIDGTGNPDMQKDREVAIIPDGKPGEGGSFIIAQRWVHDLVAFEQLPLVEQEKLFER